MEIAPHRATAKLILSVHLASHTMNVHLTNIVILSGFVNTLAVNVSSCLMEELMAPAQKAVLSLDMWFSLWNIPFY